MLDRGTLHVAEPVRRLTADVRLLQVRCEEWLDGAKLARGELQRLVDAPYRLEGIRLEGFERDLAELSRAEKDLVPVVRAMATIVTPEDVFAHRCRIDVLKPGLLEGLPELLVGREDVVGIAPDEDELRIRVHVE